jgi:hypothetical protein
LVLPLPSLQSLRTGATCRNDRWRNMQRRKARALHGPVADNTFVWRQITAQATC